MAYILVSLMLMKDTILWSSEKVLKGFTMVDKLLLKFQPRVQGAETSFLKQEVSGQHFLHELIFVRSDTVPGWSILSDQKKKSKRARVSSEGLFNKPLKMIEDCNEKDFVIGCHYSESLLLRIHTGIIFKEWKYVLF